MVENHEPFIGVWLDSEYAIPYDESYRRKSQLNSIINFNIKFSDCDECLDYIKNIHNENIFFIISGSLGENFLPIIYNFPQILYIYIYCTNKIKHEQWTKNEKYIGKIHGVFVDIDQLLAKINDDVKFELKNLLPSNIFHKYDVFKLKEMTIKDLNSQSAHFMWFQLLINTLINGSYTENAKDDMFQECIEQYENNEIELKKIIEFYNNYTAKEAICWYTKNCFLYRLLNKAFRIQNINLIFKFRFFIKDLYNQLNDIWLNQNPNGSFIKVYRGQLMSYNELENLKENIGQLISINTFFSTTLLSSVASDFAGNGGGRPHYESVFFEINIDCTSISKPFANIKNYSFMKDENEVLFCVGTVFRIISVEEFDNAWYVILQTSNDENIELKQLLEHFNRTVVEQKPTLMALVDLLEEMGEYNKAQNFAQLFMNELELVDQPHYTSIIQTTIGILDYYQGNFHKAMKTCETALIVQLQQDTSEYISDDLQQIQHELGISYNNVAIIYYHMSRYNEAKNFFNKAVSLIPNNHLHIGALWSNLALLYSNIHEYEMALDYCKKSLALYDTILPKYHPSIAHTNMTMGLINHAMGDYDNALKNYEEASEINRVCLTLDHPSEAVVQANRGMIYIDKGEFQTAIDVTNKALSMFEKFQNHPTLATMYNNLGLAHLRCGDYSLARENLEKTLEIELISLPEARLKIAATYNNLASIYFEEDDYDMALEYYNKTLQIQTEYFPTKLNGQMALTYNNIGSIHYRLEQYSTALENFEQALTIMKKCLPANHFDFSLIYNNIGLVYAEIGEYTKALDNYNQALNIETLKDHPFIARTYLNIGDVYRMTENHELALEIYKKSLEIQLKSLTPDNQVFLRTYNLMTVVYNAMNNKEMSLKYYKKFLEYLLSERPMDFDEHLTAYKDIADLLLTMKNFELAMEYYEKAMTTAQNVSSTCSEALKAVQEMIDLLKPLVRVSHSANETDDTID